MAATSDTPSFPASRPLRAPRTSWFGSHVPELFADQLGFVTRLAREYGEFVPLRLTPYRGAFLNHPGLIEEVLVTSSRSFVKGLIWRRLDELVGNGILISEGEFWRRQRRSIQPAFHRERVAGYGRVMVEYAERLIESWQDGQQHEIHREMTRLLLDVVCKTLVDADVGEESDEVAATFAAALHAYEDLTASLQIILPRAIPSPARLRMRRAVRRLDGLIFRIIRARRANPGEHGDMLSLLLQAGDEDDGAGMTDRQVRDEVTTIILAGHETTSLVLTWAWYLLAQHPEAEARLHAELSQVLGGRAPTVADLPALAYTEMVISETMRLYPPAWATVRDAREETRIGGHRIAKGTIVLMNQWTMHRDPRYFEDPEAFRPERWSDGLAKRLPRFVYFPFGGGPRVCIGGAFAQMATRLMLATIARRFRLELVPGQAIVPEPGLTLRPKHGIRMTVLRRD